ncbi:hypothetical protein RHSIM_Rhsim06G0155200 [Rhododendron simsii]|uniref:Gnk2-homologous domain-containing protein n=1 Tax=Rhododendron simsii TaxID=118357 RepID=A0A834H2P0_RHOSS|nr:hypothetical protein RHSIM_Rhsim06G0155200 [Rhododendron simsii]
MSSSRLLSALYLLSLSLLLQLALGANLVTYTCYGSGNFTPNGPYNQNLNNLLGILDYNTPLSGFAFSSLGQSQNIQSYGLALCRGDINTTACRACVDEATTKIQNLCQFKNEAAIWYDVCQVKYSNVNFLGVVSTRQWELLWNTANASNPDYFNGKVIELFSQLKGEALYSPKLYAAGTLEIGYSTTIYGLVQCTRDLSGDNCAKCIDVAVKIIEQDAYGKVGANFLGESCDVHYEIYPWF